MTLIKFISGYFNSYSRFSAILVLKVLYNVERYGRFTVFMRVLGLGILLYSYRGIMSVLIVKKTRLVITNYDRIVIVA